MPDVTIIKLKVRRGTEYQRNLVILEQGELGYTTDTKRLFVGDGILSGGNIVSNITHLPVQSVSAIVGLTNAMRGDTVMASNLLYQLTGTDFKQLSGWSFIGTRVGTSLSYDTSNRLEITKTVSTPITGFRNLNYNQFGQVIGSVYTVNNTFTGNALTPSLSIFNGSPNQITRRLTFPGQTVIPVISGSPSGATTTINLTAAGFITVENTSSQNGTNVDRFAIPIFSF